MTDYVVTARFDDGTIAAQANASATAMLAAADAGDKVVASTSRVTQNATRLVNSLDPVTRATNSLAAAQAALTAKQAALADGVARGQIAQDQAGRSLETLSAKVRSAQASVDVLTTGTVGNAAALEANAEAADHAAGAHAGFYREVLVLGHEIVTGNYNRIPGSLMVLAERTGNLETLAKSAFAALTSVPGIIATAAVAGVAAFTVMAVHAEDANLAFQRTQNTLELTRNDYLALADTVRAVAAAEAVLPQFNGSRTDATQAATTIAAVPTFSGTQADLQAMLTLANNLSIALGKTVPEAAQQLAAGLRDPAAEAKRLAEEGFRGLTAAAVESITHLEAIGQTSKASAELMDALRVSTDGIAQNLTPFQQALASLDEAFTTNGNHGRAWGQSIGDAIMGIATTTVNAVAIIAGVFKQAQVAVASGNSPLGNVNPDNDTLDDIAGRTDAGALSTLGPVGGGFPHTTTPPFVAQNNQLLLQADAATSGGKQAMRDQITLLQTAQGLVDTNSDSWKRYQEQIDKDTKSLTGAETAAEKMGDKLREQVELIDITTGSSQALAAAYLEGGDAVAKLTALEEAKKQAEKDFPKDISGRVNAIQQLVVAYTAQGQAEAALSAAKDVNTSQDQLAMLQQESNLVTSDAATRDHVLAVMKEQQKLVREAHGDETALYTDAGKAALNYAGRVADATSALQHQQQVLSDLENAASSAFDSVGNSIVNAFTAGSGAAVSFGSVMQGVISAIISEVAKLAVINPILNSLFGGNKTTLGDVTGLLGGTSSPSSSGGSSFGIGDIGNAFSLTKLLGFDPLQSLGITGPGGLFGGSGGLFSGVGSFLSTPLFGTAGAADIGASALFGGAGAGAEAIGSGITTIGGLAGGVGLGFGAGSLLNNLLGGNQLGGTVGSGLGSAAGAAIGTFVFPGIGTLLGGLLGGLAGGGLGGLFGPGPANHGWRQSINVQPDGTLGLGLGGFNKFDGTQILSTLSQEISTLNSTMAQFGISASATTNQNAQLQTGVTVSGHGGGFNAGNGADDFGVNLDDPKAFSQLRFQPTDQKLAADYAGRSFQSTADLAAFSTFVSQTLPNLLGTGTKLGSLADQITALDSAFAAATTQAQQYGLATDDLTAGLATQTAALQKAANDMVVNTKASLYERDLTAKGDSVDAQLFAFDMSAPQQWADLSKNLTDTFGDAYKNTADYAAIMKQLTDTLADERKAIAGAPQAAIDAANQQAQDQASQGADGLITNLQSYVQNLVGGQANPTSPVDQFNAASGAFDVDAAAAAKGDAKSVSSLTSYADTLLNTARTVFGSGQGYADAYNRVIAALQKVGNISAETLTASVFRETTQTQTAILSSDIQTLNSTLQALRNDVKLAGAMPGRLVGA